jgi:hypothetical protein
MRMVLVQQRFLAFPGIGSGSAVQWALLPITAIPAISDDK